MTLEAVEQKQEEEEPKTMTWRVLRRDPDTIPNVTRWYEEEALTGEGQFGWYPDAKEVGGAYGEGDYILIRQVGTDIYCTAIRLTIVADKVYRSATGDDQR